MGVFKKKKGGRGGGEGGGGQRGTGIWERPVYVWVHHAKIFTLVEGAQSCRAF